MRRHWDTDIFQFICHNEKEARELTRTLYGASSVDQEYAWIDALIFDAFQQGWQSLQGIAQQMKEHESDSEDCTEPVGDDDQ